jgi:hypothetical protein
MQIISESLGVIACPYQACDLTHLDPEDLCSCPFSATYLLCDLGNKSVHALNSRFFVSEYYCTAMKMKQDVCLKDTRK